MRVLPYGASALLVEVDSASERADLTRSLEAHPIAGVSEQVPAARTVLLVLEPGADQRQISSAVAALPPTAPPEGTDDQSILTIEVTYDGPDLGEVGDHLGIDAAEVVRRHVGQLWTCEFVGFLPGFGYLVGDQGDLEVPRRDTPRTRIPAGSVALAASWSAIYPSASPGGWQLIGRTDTVLFDPDRDEPGLLRANCRVQFVECG